MDKKPKDLSRTFTNFVNRGMTAVDASMLQKNAVPALLKTLPSASAARYVADPSLITTRVPELLRAYNQKLMDDGKMLSFREVKKMDMLDVTGFLPPLPDDCSGIPNLHPATEEEKAAIGRLGWYSYVPCFEKGAMKLNRFRYIVFEITELDPENQSVKVKLRDYIKPKDGCWQMGVGTTVSVSIAPDADEYEDPDRLEEVKHVIRVENEGSENFEQIYTIYNAEDMHWSRSDYQTWMDIVVQNGRIATRQVYAMSGTDQCGQLAQVFTLINSRCNAMLEMNRPSRPVREKKPGMPSGKKTVTYEKGEAPERKIRMVGALRVQSASVPRTPCLETVITYKVAKWTVRGHVRRYKSGKEVYIKPTTRTRKALEGTGEATATTIRFKKKKGT